jgi:hypothetical protein
VDAEEFNLEMLINSMKELRQMQLNDQVREALEGAKLRLDQNMVNELIHELETDIEEHIQRLEKISNVLTEEERAHPELIDGVRRQEVAFQSGCDLEEVDSLCEAFSRAREILTGLKRRGSGVLDVKLLFSNLPGLSGMDVAGEGDVSNVLRGLLDGSVQSRAESDLSDIAARNDEFEELFDLEQTKAPKNRLPKDWNP